MLSKPVLLTLSRKVDEMMTSMSRVPPAYPYASRQHTNKASQSSARLPNGLTPLRTEPYSISSNPPNPKLSFRAGDWMYVVTPLT